LVGSYDMSQKFKYMQYNGTLMIKILINNILRFQRGICNV